MVDFRELGIVCNVLLMKQESRKVINQKGLSLLNQLAEIKKFKSLTQMALHDKNDSLIQK